MATPDIATLLKYINLQMAGEAIYPFGFTNGPIEPSELIEGNNRNSKFPTALALQFKDDWKVVAHKENTPTGFSGTLFECLRDDPALGLRQGELVLSIRSTEFVDDAARDCEATNKEIKAFGFGFGQLADLKKWWDELNAAGGPLSAGQRVTVTGYSLGAHLATAFNILQRETGQPSRIDATYLFNGAGVGEIRPEALAVLGAQPLNALMATFERQRTNADDQQIGS